MEPQFDKKLPRLFYVDTTNIITATFNPGIRTGDRQTKPLIDAMKRYGRQLVPAQVKRAGSKGKYRVWDGHRRFHACCELGWPLLCIEIPEDFKEGELYADINNTQRKHTQDEWLDVWLIDPRAVPPKKDGSFSELFVNFTRGDIIEARHLRYKYSRIRRTTNQVNIAICEYNLAEGGDIRLSTYKGNTKRVPSLVECIKVSDLFPSNQMETKVGRLTAACVFFYCGGVEPENAMKRHWSRETLNRWGIK